MQQKIRTEKSPTRGKLSHKSGETRNVNLVHFVPQKSPRSCCLEIMKAILKNKKDFCFFLKAFIRKNFEKFNGKISEILIFLYF